MLQKLRIATGLLLACALFWPTPGAFAQGVTTGSISGVVKDAQGLPVPGATVTALHEPSGSSYEAVAREDGRFTMPALRVGGPYTVTAALAGFQSAIRKDVFVTLGTGTDLSLKLETVAMAESVTVTAQAADAVFSSTRTGAATAVVRDELAVLPTVSGRINDMTRMSPQYSGSGSFAGQDSRMNNITVDGAYFNNSFGLRNQPGETSGVAPISLEAIEQVQVSVAPFDVRQGNFVGAGVNTVTRSGTNRYTGSFYYRMRNESFVGKEAMGLPFNPGTFDTTVIGEWAGGPIVKNKLFFFESFEKQEDTRPLNTYLANPGGVTPSGNVTRVLKSDMDALSAYLSKNFGYETGPYENISKTTPGKPLLLKGDYNINGSNKVTFRYTQLASESPVNLSSSTSLGNGRPTFSTNFLNFKSSNYSILENIKSGIGEWNSVIGTRMSNNLLAGYTTNDESRGDIGKLFPFVDILDGAGTTYTSIGSEPFTPNNELRYHTYQVQDSFTKFGEHHSMTFGGAFEKYYSENVFFPGKQSAYVYNTLADFYADFNGYLANPNRTVSAVPLRRFQVRYNNVPGADKPIQPLDVYYTSLYAQDEWKPRSNLTVTGGIRVDIAKFGDTAYDNPVADQMTFRDAGGNAVKYDTGALPKASPLWSPRVGINWDVNGDQMTQVRGGIGIFTGKPAFVWISNQIGNTGMLTGFTDTTAGAWTNYPFNPDPDHYKPATISGAPPASTNLAVTDPNFKFPQTWRNNIALDQKLPWGLIGTVEYIYNRDVNGASYINANLPAAQGAFTGVDKRMRWMATPSVPACVTGTAGNPVPCVSRLNNLPGSQITDNIVLGNQDIGRSWNFAASVTKPMSHGFNFKGAYTYGRSRNTVDPGSIASGSWTGNQISNDPNNPGLGYSSNTPGHRFFLSATYSKRYFGWGATTVSAFFDARTASNTSYIFAADANGDTATNDLIYIPRDASEMNFVSFTTGGKTFSAADQAAAFEAYISQDAYLSKHRGQYAERGGVFYPFINRLDLSVSQDLFTNFGGMKHSGQIRLDITNFGNMLNHNWGVGYSIIQNRLLSAPLADATGALSYRLATVTTATGPELISKTFQRTASTSDVYVMMLSFRYTFN